MLVTGAISLRGAAASIDVRTMALLLAMMAIVAPLQLFGLFGRVIAWVTRRVAHPAALLVLLILVSGVLSALFLNDTICIAFTPLVLELAATRRHPPLPYLLALATSSNIGSVATVIGNPQNMLIGSVSGVSPLWFTLRLAPVALAGLVVDAVVIWIAFRHQLTAQPEGPAVVVANPPAPTRITAGALARTIDWRLLALFAGLFVVVGAAEQAGIDRRLFAVLRPLGIDTVAGLSATAALLSNAISNVPAVMLFTHVVPKLPDPLARLARTGDGQHARREPHDSRIDCEPDRRRRRAPARRAPSASARTCASGCRLRC